MSDYGITPDEFHAMARDARSMIGRLLFCGRIGLPEKEAIRIYQKSYR